MKIVVTGFAAALTAAISLGAVAPVHAQYQPPPYRAVLPPFEVMTIIRSMGFDPISRPVLRGPVYAVNALDDGDIPVRVLVDARSGNVVRVTENGPGRAYAGTWPGARYEARRLPPESVPPGMVDRPDDEDMVPPAAHAPPPPPKPKVAARTPLPRPAPPQSKAAATPPPVSGTATIIPDPGNTPGKSIPAPVAKSATATDVTGSTDAASPPASDAKPSTADPKQLELKPTVMVPVAPLE
jgi:hypothetical protein